MRRARIVLIAAVLAASAFNSQAGRPPEIVISVADHELALV
jgi:hypothetical protein